MLTPPGTITLYRQIIAAVRLRPERFQRTAGLAALEKAIKEVKALPSWQEPFRTQEAAAKPKPGKGGKKGGGKKKKVAITRSALVASKAKSPTKQVAAQA